MPPKKDAKAAPAGGPDLAADLQKAQTIGVVTAANFNDRLKPVEAEVERLRRQNAELQSALSKAQDEGKATYTFAQQQVAKKDAQIDNMRSTIERLEAELARKPSEIKQAVETAVGIVQAELHKTQHKLREREQALEKLADFRMERDQLLAELDNTRQELEKEKDVHSTDVAMLQRVNVADREHVRGILLERLKTAKSEIMKQAAEQMGESVKRIVAENAAMLHELAYQSKQAERLATQVDKLTDENSTLRMNLSVAEGELRELFRRVSAMAGALKQARGHLKQVQAHESRLVEKERDAEARERAIEEKAEAYRRRIEMYKGLQYNSPSTVLSASAAPSVSTGGGRQWIKSESVRLPAPMAQVLGTAGTGTGGASSPARVGVKAQGTGGKAQAAETKELELQELQLVDTSAYSSGGAGTGPGTAGAGAGNTAIEVEVDRAALDAALDIIVLMDAQRAEILAVADDVTSSLLRAATAVRLHVQALAGGASGTTAAAGSRAGKSAKELLEQAEGEAAEVAGMQGNDAVLFMEAAQALERLLGHSGDAGTGGAAAGGAANNNSSSSTASSSYAWNLKPVPVSSASAVSGPSALALLKGGAVTSSTAASSSVAPSAASSPAHGSYQGSAAGTGTGTAASDPASLGGHSSWAGGSSGTAGGALSRGILATAPPGVLPISTERLPVHLAPVVARGGTLQAADAVAAGVATQAQQALVLASGSGPSGVRALSSSSAGGAGGGLTPGKVRATGTAVVGSLLAQAGAGANAQATKEAVAVYSFLHFLIRRMKAVLADMQRAVPAPLTVEQLLHEHALGGAGAGVGGGAEAGLAGEASLASPGFGPTPGFSVESEKGRVAVRAALASKASVIGQAKGAGGAGTGGASAVALPPLAAPAAQVH